MSTVDGQLWVATVSPREHRLLRVANASFAQMRKALPKKEITTTRPLPPASERQLDPRPAWPPIPITLPTHDVFSSLSETYANTNHTFGIRGSRDAPTFNPTLTQSPSASIASHPSSSTPLPYSISRAATPVSHN
jgi:hypothetical protein